MGDGGRWEGLLRINTSVTVRETLSLRPRCGCTILCHSRCKRQHVQASGSHCCITSQQAFMVRFFPQRRRERRERDLLRQVRRRCRVTDVEEVCRKDRGEGRGEEEGGGGRGRGVRSKTTARFRWERKN